MKKIVYCLLVVAGMALPSGGQGAPATPPTFTNVPYGTHPREVLDFWQAKSAQPTPVVFHIHGGGWVTGDKKGVADLDKFLAAGISVVSINYRYSWQAQLEGVTPPLEWPMQDTKRALQFVRSKAAEWNLDKTRVAATGGSAGGCSSLWLALHNEMADPQSPDPVAHESTRLFCVAVGIAQTSLDPRQMKEWTPNSRYGGHAFGLMDPNDLKTRDTRFAEFLERRQEFLPWIKEYSPIEHVTADDPPVYLWYDSVPELGKNQKDPTHTANFGVEMAEKLKKSGVEVEFVHRGSPGKHASIAEFLIEKLNEKNP